MKNENINVVMGEQSLLSCEEVVQNFRNRRLLALFLKRNINYSLQSRLIYYPIWLIKILVRASRWPFKDKVVPSMGFIDGMNGSCGLLSVFPNLQIEKVENKEIVHPKIMQSETLGKYIAEVKENHLNRMYLIKKPEMEIKEVSLSYLPLWEVVFPNIEGGERLRYFNANNGKEERNILIK